MLDTGAEALIARAWLTDHAERTLEVQYFIWSTDNVGILAAEALLRAAERGVKVRVIVDDLLIDAPDESLLALARHPNIDIRIYNPKSSVGTPLQKRVVNVATDFRGVNQRMHNKVLLIDGKAAITGGRNMADEYFDYDHEYNFRDRDVLLVGAVVGSVAASFELFWASPLSVPVEELYDGLGLMQKHVEVGDAEVQEIYRRAARLRRCDGELRARGPRSDRGHAPGLPAARRANRMGRGRVHQRRARQERQQLQSRRRWAGDCSAGASGRGARRRRSLSSRLTSWSPTRRSTCSAAPWRAACECASTPTRSPPPTT